MESLSILAPAKINLMLDVTGKRSDGYHTLITVMQTISLADTLEITANNNGRISIECDNNSIPTTENNIAYKAAAKFFEYSQKQGGVHIKINKKIPTEAGLGGGSADGAAVLVGLNKLFNTHLTVDELCCIGVKIGADVPFCIVGGTKLCCGIGEIMSDIPALENCYIAIGKGKTGISTQLAFAEIDKKGFGKNVIKKGYDGTVNSVLSIGKNIFEEVIDNDDVKFLKHLFEQNGAVYSALSGSGSAVFGLFCDVEAAKKSVLTLSEKNYFSSLSRPVTHGAVILN